MTGYCNSCHQVFLRRAALAASVLLFAPAVAAAPLTLQVEASDTLPGFHIGDLPRYLALHMAEARLPDWRVDEQASPSAILRWSTASANAYATELISEMSKVHHQRTD